MTNYVELRITERKIETKTDAFAFGFAETIGKVFAWALLIVGLAWYFEFPVTHDAEATRAETTQ